MMSKTLGAINEKINQRVLLPLQGSYIDIVLLNVIFKHSLISSIVLRT